MTTRLTNRIRVGMTTGRMVGAGVALALLVPTGVAVAQTADPGDQTTSVVVDQIRDRLRDGTCIADGTTTDSTVADQLIDRQQDRDQLRDGSCLLDPTTGEPIADQLQTRDRDRIHVDDALADWSGTAYRNQERSQVAPRAATPGGGPGWNGDGGADGRR